MLLPLGLLHLWAYVYALSLRQIFRLAVRLSSRLAVVESVLTLHASARNFLLIYLVSAV